MKPWISRYQKIAGNFNIQQEILLGFGVILFGAALGIVAKATDATTLIGAIGTDLSIWVLLGTLIAFYSHHPISAGINTMLFFLALLAGYYTYGQLVLGFFPVSYFYGWLVVALASLPCGSAVWFAKRDGLVGAMITALPVGLIWAWSYSAFYTHNIVQVLGIIYGILLCTLLPRQWQMKCGAAVLSVTLAVIIETLHLLSILPF